jgi:hypothetical protein
MKTILSSLFIICLYTTTIHGQSSFPIMVGGQAEFGSGYFQQEFPQQGLGRINVFAGLYLPALGIVKVNYGGHNIGAVDSIGNDVSENFRSYGLQIGGTLGGAGKPYAYVTYQFCRILGSLGDSEWQEWGLGMGSSWIVSPWATLFIEAEHRWINDHELASTGTSIYDAKRWQINLGIMMPLL